MWYEVGVKIALEQTGATLGEMGAAAAPVAGSIGSLAPVSWAGRMGQSAATRIAGPGAAVAGRTIGKALPFGASALISAPSAWAARNRGGSVEGGEGATDAENAFVNASQRGDRNAWQHLPPGYETQSNAGAIEGFITAPLAVLPATAALTAAGNAPGYLASMNRKAQGDSREDFYNPKMLQHLFARQAPPSPANDTRGFMRRTWEDTLRPTGNVLRQAVTRPIQTLASGAGIIRNDMRNVWNDITGGFRRPAAPAAAPPAAPQAPAAAPPAPPVQPPPQPVMPKQPSTVT